MKLEILHQPINEALKDWLAAGAIGLSGLAYGQEQEPKPIVAPAEATTGLATYCTVESCKKEGNSGVYTANGEKFDEKALTCAMRRRDWGSKFKVTNLENGKEIIVRLNDYGPGKKPTARGVVIDLTPEGFRQLGAGRKGEIKVKVEPIK
jgi:rare lipoprotein A